MKKMVLFLFLSLFFWVTGVKGVEAAAYLTVSPTSGNYSVDDIFVVTLGVNSGGDTIGGVDGVGTYDSSKLELTSIVQADNMVFENVDGGGACTIKDDEEGKFSYACYANQSYGDKSVTGDLVKLTFKATDTGTASLNYNCASGSTADSNIVGVSSITDIIACGSNQSGSYTIGDGTSTSTSTSTTAPTGTTSVLPQTGSTGVTIGLIAFGLVSLVSAAFFKFL